MLVEEQVFIIVKYQYKRLEEEIYFGCFLPRKWSLFDFENPDLMV